MPRQARAIYQGECYHIISRGNNKQWIFLDDDDFAFYVSLLVRYRKKWNAIIHHYCLMNNHTHFLMKCGGSNKEITSFMHGLQTSYVCYFKKKYGVSGHVFENRFKDHHIENESYLLECGRYIERNPVRAGMVKEPGKYHWSSYNHYATGSQDLILIINPLYHELGRTEQERRNKYQEYVETPRAYETIVDAYFEERVLI